ncbi:unnamed protein product [Mucor hiemalis]
MTYYYSVNSNIANPTHMKKQPQQQEQESGNIMNLHSQLNSPTCAPDNHDRGNTNKTSPVIQDKQRVYTETLLVGPSIINASPPKNNRNISLPSMNEFIHNQNDNRILSRDHPSNHNPWCIPPPHFTFSSSSSTPVPHRRSMVSDNPHHPFQQQITSSDTLDSRTTITATTKSRPLKRQRTITPPNAYILPKKRSEKEKQRCHSCQSTETPEWRKGPLGPRTLCNACGLIWTKLCKQQDEGDKSRRKFKNNRSTSSTASPSTTSITTITSPVTMEDCKYFSYLFWVKLEAFTSNLLILTNR